MVENPVPMVEKMREFKLSMNINSETEIIYDPINREIRFGTDSGRCCRPLFTTDNNGQLKITKERINKMEKQYLDGWLQLQAEGLVEYVDVEEEETAMIAMFPHYINRYPSEHAMFTKCVEVISDDNQKQMVTETVVKKIPRYTHCEIHPATVLGVAAHSVVFSHHNPAARNTFQCLWEETPVLMNDDTYKKIKDVKIGDSIKTFSPDKLQITSTRVIDHIVRSTNKNIYKLTVDTGETIVATYDHQFMTNDGWKRVCRIKKGTLMAMYPNSGNKDNVNGKMILVRIKSITKHNNVMVADLTTESENHSFIANGFGVHNCAMSKQAIGIFATNFDQRMDTMAHILWYPQKPLATTKGLNSMGFNDVPGGINAVVAICCYSGYSQV